MLENSIVCQWNSIKKKKIRIRLKNWLFVNTNVCNSRWSKDTRHDDQQKKKSTAFELGTAGLFFSINYHVNVCNYWVVNQFEERAVLRMRQIIRGNVDRWIRQKAGSLPESFNKNEPTYVHHYIPVLRVVVFFSFITMKKKRFEFHAKLHNIINFSRFISNDILINYKFLWTKQNVQVCMLIYHFWRFPTNQSMLSLARKEKKEEKKEEIDTKIIQLK